MLIHALIEAAQGHARVPRGRQSLRLFHIETAGCEGCGMEVAALRGAAYGLARADIAFVDRPEAADFLLVTGALSRAMAPELDRAWQAMPARRGLIAIGACAIDGGPFGETYALLGGLSRLARTTIDVPGCPAEPAAILDGLLTLAARREDETAG